MNPLKDNHVYESCKYMRGQVWMTRSLDSASKQRMGFKASSVVNSGHAILICSSYIGNKTSSIVSGFPMTSTIKDLGVNLKLKCPDGVIRSINCSQSIPIDKSDLVSYMYSVSDEVVEACLDKYNASCDYFPKQAIDDKMHDIHKLMLDIEKFNDSQDRLNAESHEAICKIARTLEASYNELREKFILNKKETPVLGIFTDKSSSVDYSEYCAENEQEKPASKRGFKTYLHNGITPEKAAFEKEQSVTVSSPEKPNIAIEPLRKPSTAWSKDVLELFYQDIEKMAKDKGRDEWAKLFGYETYTQAKKAYYNLRWSERKNKK